MKKLLVLVAIAFGAYSYFGGSGTSVTGLLSPSTPIRASSNADAALAQAFSDHASQVQITGSGVVVKLLADDNTGRRHQRFIVSLRSGQSVLVAHNIDLARRIDALREGDDIEFSGVYEWNDKGGVIHWTHHDPAGSHSAGWLKHRGQTYQ